MAQGNTTVQGLDRRGFTLMELLIVLSVVVIVLAVGVPSLRTFILNSRSAAIVNELNTALNFARSEALKRSQDVIVCRVADAQAEVPVCDTGNGWSDGWIVYADAQVPADGLTNKDEVLRRFSAPPAGTTLTSTIASGQVEFDRLGTTQGPSTGRINYCDTRGPDKSRSIFISMQGRLRVDKAPSGSCPVPS